MNKDTEEGCSNLNLVGRIDSVYDCKRQRLDDNASSVEEVNDSKRQRLNDTASSVADLPDSSCQEEEEEDNDIVLLITKEEERLLNPNYWIDNHHDWSYSDKSKTLNFVREAYISIRRRTCTHDDMVDVLRDTVARLTLFRFAYSIGILHEYSLCITAALVSLRPSTSYLEPSEDPSPSPSPSPRHLDKSVKGICISCCSLAHLSNATNFTTSNTQALSSVENFFLVVEEEFIKLVGKPPTEEANIISIRIYNILLILREILIKIGINPLVSEGDEKIKAMNAFDEMEVATAVEGSKKDMDTKSSTDKMEEVAATEGKNEGMETINVADKVEEVTDAKQDKKVMETTEVAENLCTKCGNSLTLLVDSEENMTTTNIAYKMDEVSASKHEKNNVETTNVTDKLKEVAGAGNVDVETTVRTLISTRCKSLQNNIRQGFVKRYFVDDKFSELMGVVEAGMSQLWTVIANKNGELADLIAASQTFELNTKEFKLGLACGDRVCTLTEKLLLNLSTSFNFLSNFNEGICLVFKNLIELINPGELLPAWNPDRVR